MSRKQHVSNCRRGRYLSRSRSLFDHEDEMKAGLIREANSGYGLAMGDDGGGCFMWCLVVLLRRKHPETRGGSEWKPYLNYKTSSFVADPFFNIKSASLHPSQFLFSHREHWPHLALSLHRHCRKNINFCSSNITKMTPPNRFDYIIHIWPTQLLRQVSLDNCVLMYMYILSLFYPHSKYTQLRTQCSCSENNVFPQTKWSICEQHKAPNWTSSSALCA